MNRRLAAAVVVLSAAAVLVLELLSARLVAPYAGLTLETYTASIGVALGAIAAGAYLGGRWADTADPLAAIGPALAAAGLLALLARPLVLTLGPALRGAGSLTALLLVGAGIALPVALLSAVPPMVVKTRLARLGETGSVVGSVSALGTLGALAGTFVTGYVLLTTLPGSWVLLVTGGLLIALGAGLTLRHGLDRRRHRRAGALAGAVVIGAGLVLAVPSSCDVETAYYCASVEADPARPGGRVLYLDDLRHSYVDLDDPTHLEFAYAKRIADVLDVAEPRPAPVRALHIGGGGFTLPRWLAATRPGSRSRVLELDPSVVALVRTEMGLVTGPDLAVRTGDARLGITAEPSAGYDIVIGDAFGGLSVPWHLTTREFAGQVRRVLRPDGLYLVNVIDNPPLSFLAAELATLREVFPRVALLARAEQLSGSAGGNFVIVAGAPELDAAALATLAARRGEPGGVASPAQITELTGDARPLRDDWAPVDQLLTPYVAPAR